MAGKKKSFIFNVEWQEILLAYPGEVRLEVYDAIIEYVASGTVSELKPMAKMAFSFIKKEIDYNNQKYEEIVAKRREAGKKSTEKRYHQNQQEIAEQANDNTDSKCQQVSANANKCQQMVAIYDNDNDIKETTTKVVAKKSKDAAKAATLSRKEKFYDSLVPFLNEYPKEMIRAFFDYWSEMNKSGTKMRWEQEKTWEISKRLRTWANREKGYGNNRSISTKQEANDYAMQKLAERIGQREQGVSSEVQHPW